MKKTLFWMYLATIVVLSLLPTSQLPSDWFSVSDKLQHLAGYALLTLLALFAYPARPVLQVGLALLVMSGMVELAQAASGWRSGEWADMLANGTGIGLALLIGSRWLRPMLSNK